MCPADTFQNGTCGLASICCFHTDINTTNKDEACRADGGICRPVCWPYEIDTGMCRFSRCCVSSDVPDLLAALSLKHVQAAVLIRGFVQPFSNCQARAQDTITAFAALVSLTNTFIAKSLEEVANSTLQDICTSKGGTCRNTCSSNENNYETCGFNLGQCCIAIDGCRLMPACDNHFGECRKQCHSFERVVAGGCGRHCTCCTSRPAVCPATHDTCAGTSNSTLQDMCTTKGGTCRNKCFSNEKISVTCGLNFGHCCIPIGENITTTDQCRGSGGKCKYMCPAHTFQNGKCGLTSNCCFSNDRCRLMPACDNHFGECRKQCHNFERAVTSGCGRHCICCTSRPAVCPATQDTCTGTCIDGRFCPSHFQLSGICSGDSDCVCCSSNSTLQDICTTNGGTCRKTCSPNEKSYVTCGSNLGHCCIPIVGCRLMPACDNHFGECRKQCHSFERAVAGGCGRYCTCCTSRPAVCPATQDTCTGTCIDRRFCPSNFQLSGICSGDSDCVCCSSNSTLQDICTTKGGTCRNTCSPNEKSYVTCGSNLGHCCIPIVGEFPL
ncbi:hypothetical protein Pcinc_015951 [Petrolisthes cinctipes]|uniref:Beta-defensin n=1 Tax=Petrolisthes cinctipes TaxID=88211 RepID=A0AAE1FS18_PETCI|nr:hypothetical protein Pcinc_015951 [Petrolisthes cinctipes]